MKITANIGIFINILVPLISTITGYLYIVRSNGKTWDSCISATFTLLIFVLRIISFFYLLVAMVSIKR